MKAPQILDREFLELRAKILELAASLDRLERADQDVTDDDRFQRLEQGIAILLDKDSQKAARVQMLFSREYDSNWREQLKV